MKRQPTSQWAFLALVLCTVVVGFVAYSAIAAERTHAIQASNARIQLQALHRGAIDEETGVRGYAATHDRLFLEPYYEANAQYRAELQAAEASLQAGGLTAQLRALVQYATMRDAWERTVQQPLLQSTRGDAREVALLRRGKRDVDAMRAVYAALDAQLASITADASTRIAQSIALAIACIVCLTAALGAVAITVEARRAQAQAALNLQLDARNAELERSNQSLQEFAYVASHDLQEPLRTVASFAQLLDRRYRGKLDEAADEYITFIVDGATRMQALINDILQYSRVGTSSRDLKPADLNAAFLRARGSLQQMIADKNAVVEADELPKVWGDPSQLGQLMQNLIGNGLKYNQSPQPAVRIAARHSRGGNWTVSVTDNGIGIEPQYFDRIFGLFQRLHGREEYSGTGIGLALCKRIVERHGGRIWVESVEGSGTTFYFTLRDAAEVMP